jgi:hypothetical protein
MRKTIILLLPGLLLISILSAICYGDSCPGDTDCDRVVDGSDLSNFVEDYGSLICPDCIVAPVPKTGLTTSVYPGDDGDLQKGIEWPTPRFTDNGDGTVTDHLTGLIWLKDVNCLYRDTWSDAVNICSTLADGQCGLNDGSVPGEWRLPNVRELFSMVDISNYSTPFLGDLVYLANYWSSTKYAGKNPYEVNAWRVHINSGETIPNNLGTYYYIWPVRDAN